MLYKLLRAGKRPAIRALFPAHRANEMPYKYYILDKQSENLTHLESMPQNAYFWGYWQALDYFKHIDSALRAQFCLKAPLDATNLALQSHIKATPNAIFLHIRRGDYLLYPAFHQLDISYYERAIARLKQNLGHLHIFVFSDDIAWCEGNLLNMLSDECKANADFKFIKNNDEGNAVSEMELMRACRHGIIANSTFSWWASYLIDNPSKIIIAPSRFFTPLTQGVPPHPRYIQFKEMIIIDA